MSALSHGGDAARFNALKDQADDLERDAWATDDPDERHDLLQEALYSRAAAVRLLTGEAA
jgi:hypothetical protein